MRLSRIHVDATASFTSRLSNPVKRNCRDSTPQIQRTQNLHKKKGIIYLTKVRHSLIIPHMQRETLILLRLIGGFGFTNNPFNIALD
jgi:hypothetical protein